jgi:hypothetical protein
MLFSTIAGCYGASYGSGHAYKVASCLDGAGAITLIVLGVLAITGHLPIIGIPCGYLMILGGIVGLSILAIKYIRPAYKPASTEYDF